MIDALARRNPRERRLLAVLLMLVLPLALVAGVLLPLHERRVETAARLEQSVALAGWVEARAAEFRALSQLETAAPRAPVGSAAIERSLIAARLRESVTTLGADGDGAVDLGFGSVDFTRLAAWLSGVHPGWGYRFEMLRLDATETSGMVAARIRLVPDAG
ncbi:type II secretion system protein GspM [Citreimonas sp.]|uniref:type II secretion system protein GspM n=1 Tax=Citreimonas sp. TaxID=3036715 RepID=UPI0035C7D211